MTWLRSPRSLEFMRSTQRVRARRAWLPRTSWPTAAITALVLSVVALVEIKLSAVQSLVLPALASQLTWRLDRGASPRIVFPRKGPYDVASGYSSLPAFQQRLTTRGYRVVDQARFSKALAMAAALGLTPPARDKTSTGLLISDERGHIEYDAVARQPRFSRYEDIPDVIVRSLLYMEDRRLLGPSRPSLNPAVDIGRLARAAVFSAGSTIGLPFAFQGGSTLAIQIEKYRHSQSGRTGSVVDKLRQIVSASLRVYHDGPDTRAERRQIILDYVNSVPLGGAPGYGEVHGIGEGLRAWFDLNPQSTFDQLRSSLPTAQHTRALKQVLALLCAVRAPTRFLADDHAELERRLSYFENELHNSGVIDDEQFVRLGRTPVMYQPSRQVVRSPYRSRKGVDLVRHELLANLGLQSLSDLDRLDLEVTTTLDAGLQERASHLLQQFSDAAFIDSMGLMGPHLFATGDPSHVRYSMLLIERTAAGDVIRVNADNLQQPFDLNTMMRMELGSTAKLRTLAHYLQVVESLRAELAPLDPDARAQRAEAAGDPLTRWAAQELAQTPDAPLDTLLAHALERPYSASPYESFFTGGGVHVFHNFDPADNSRKPTVRQALANSTNLVFIRLMRDLVRYHEARLPYDANAVLSDPADTTRQRMMAEVARDEGIQILSRAYRSLRGVSPAELPERLLGRHAQSNLHWAILMWAWHPGADPDSVAEWLANRGHTVLFDDTRRWAKTYANPRFTLADYAYLLGRQPLELWCASQLAQEPTLSWDALLARSEATRRESETWLLDPHHQRAQNVRLRTRIERDAFIQMTADWRALGFPFARLVPSYATAIGSSADRPGALAELMGIIVNDGERRTPRLLEDLRFGGGTPYETVIAREPAEPKRVMSQPVARALREALAGVVENGTARRVHGVFQNPDGTPMTMGGKTGSGDNRIDSFASGGRLIASRPVSRTAAFVFYAGDRYYGVVTASVLGSQSGNYVFTSALPLEVLRRFAIGLPGNPSRAPSLVALGSASGPARESAPPVAPQPAAPAPATPPGAGSQSVSSPE